MDIRILSHMDDEVKVAPQSRGGCIFESCDSFLENMPTSHTVSLAIVQYTCSAMLLLSCAYF